MYEELKSAQNRVVGLKQLLRGLEAGSVRRVYVADDAEPSLKEKIERALEGRAVETVRAPSMEELGRTCGIDVGAACAGVLRQ